MRFRRRPPDDRLPHLRRERVQPRLAALLNNRSDLLLKVDAVTPGEGKLAAYRIAHLTGTTKFKLPDAAIAELPETQRMAVILRRYEELSYEEIAEALDQSVSAVKSLLFRARTELRDSLKRYLSS